MLSADERFASLLALRVDGTLDEHGFHYLRTCSRFVRAGQRTHTVGDALEVPLCARCSAPPSVLRRLAGLRDRPLDPWPVWAQPRQALALRDPLARAVAREVRSWYQWHPCAGNPEFILGAVEAWTCALTISSIPAKRATVADAAIGPWLAACVDGDVIIDCAWVTADMVRLAETARDSDWPAERRAAVAALCRDEHTRLRHDGPRQAFASAAQTVLDATASYSDAADDLFAVAATVPAATLADRLAAAAGVLGITRR